MSESEKTDRTAIPGHGTAPDQSVDRHPVSGVRLPADLTAKVDAWARAHAVHRSEAIRLLIERGLKLEAGGEAAGNDVETSRSDAIAVEEQAASLISQFIDPETPSEERERRIHRLTEGPPEFVSVRKDLPRR